MKSVRSLTELQLQVEILLRQLEGKETMIKHLLEKIDSMELSMQNKDNTIIKLKDIIAKYERELFGTKSEKTHKETPEDSQDDVKNDSEKVVEQTKKKVYKHPHKRNYRDIPDDKVIELKPDDKLIRGARLVKISKTYRFYYIPGRLCKVRYDRYIYSKEGKLIIPQLPYVPEELEKRYADPNLIAHLLVNKFQNHIPMERQLRMLNNGDIKIAKTTYHDWIVAGIDALDGIYEAIREKVLTDERIHIDETTMPVVNKAAHNTKKGYDWGFISPNNKLMFFARINGSRGMEVLDQQMKDFQGKYIQTDGYGAYINLGKRLGKKIINIPCMSHVRRYFKNSEVYHKEKALEALQIINQMFYNEKQYKDENLEPYQIEFRRELELRPLLDTLKSWLTKERNSKSFFSDSSIGKAIQYALDRIDHFYKIISNGLLELSNNLAERTMRSHAMGRNSFLFCQNEAAATRTCKIYSIIESCKLSKIDPYKYLCYILSKKPEPGETWDKYLPCNVSM